ADLDVVTLIGSEHRRERVAVGETRGQRWIEVRLLVEVGDLSDDLRAVCEGQITGLSGSLLRRTAARILNPERDRLVAVVDHDRPIIRGADSLRARHWHAAGADLRPGKQEGQ